MSKQSNQQIAGMLADRIAAGSSPFDNPELWLPVNPTTGKNYRGMNALFLAMQDRNDPRWMTLIQASNKQGWKIMKDSKGTLISFLKTTDRVQLLDENGRPELNSRRNPKTELIKLETPVETQAHVFNAEQIEGIPSFQEYAEDHASRRQQTPAEQLDKLIELSKAKIEATTGEAGYDPVERIIYMPDQEEFKDLGDRQAAILYELAKFAGHDKELYDPMDVSTAEQIKPALAAMFLGNQIGIRGHMAPQIDLNDILQVALNAPDELEAAANGAQYTTDYLHGLLNSPEQRQAARQERFLQVGDEIEYGQKTYEVLSKMRGRDLQVKAGDSRIKVSPGDGIYTSLLAAKTEALKQQRTQEKQPQPEQTIGEEEYQDNSMHYEHEDELEHLLDYRESREDGDEPDLTQESGNEQKTGRKR